MASRIRFGVWFKSPTAEGWLRHGEIPEMYSTWEEACNRAVNRNDVADRRGVPFEYSVKQLPEET
jgi:hypothetical protein